MTESAILFQISRIVSGGASFPQAVEQIARLLCEADHHDAPDLVKLLHSFDHTHCSLYSVDLHEIPIPRRLADFVGQQLSMLLARARLVERRAQLKREIAEIKRDLATRKLMQRAEGLLVAQRGMEAAAAKRWIAQQSQKTGLSKNDVAERVISHYQASALLEQRIA